MHDQKRLKEIYIQIETEHIKRTERYKYLEILFWQQSQPDGAYLKNVCKNQHQTEKDRESAAISNIVCKEALYKQPHNAIFQ